MLAGLGIMVGSLWNTCVYSAVTTEGNKTTIIPADSDSGDSKSQNSESQDVCATFCFPEKVYDIDIAWGDMQFTYNKGTWDPDKHVYKGADTGWKESNNSHTIGLTLNNSNNLSSGQISLVNNSNARIQTVLEYTPNSELNMTPSGTTENYYEQTGENEFAYWEIFKNFKCGVYAEGTYDDASGERKFSGDYDPFEKIGHVSDNSLSVLLFDASKVDWTKTENPASGGDSEQLAGYYNSVSKFLFMPTDIPKDISASGKCILGNITLTISECAEL